MRADQEVEHPVAKQVADAVRSAAEEVMREARSMPLPTVHMFISTHTLTWHPFTVSLGRRGSLGVPTAIPAWNMWSKHRDAQLTAPITAAMNQWRALEGADIGTTIARLRREQFLINLTDPG